MGIIKDIMRPNHDATGQAVTRLVDGHALDAEHALGVPALVREAGPDTATRFLEFFALTLRNPHTRQAYAYAVGTFLHWAQAQGARSLADVQPIHVATYVELLGAGRAKPTVKQHLSAIRGMFGWLVTGGHLQHNPAADVRGPKHVVHTGKTPVLFEEEARALFAAIDTTHVVGLRDQALIGVMLYGFARVSAALGMRVRDYESMGRRASLVLTEKGGKLHRVPAHHKVAEFLDQYLDAADIAQDREGVLFRSTRGRSRVLTEKPLQRGAALRMVKRRAAEAGLPADAICNHTFRATGVTDFIANGGSQESAQAIAAHASPRTTQLYNRNAERVTAQEIERIRI